ncbi:GntR family transcriptional regulator [Nonomuraea sp. K274]|uniref:GntR family transcriptional regulator n=1 Tax=Nonomuraea cypriaca TaxID=1187855 RepID=A0A931EYM4_9ACTN|nr:GntR family transcriptional regulator [Nonomuraea cypriaca]MBF8184223.1 GntR family transcriptional regulator [Nonomuraea cypriaca]
MTDSGPRGPLLASTLADVVYTRLHEDLVLGRLRPNSLLLEGELADGLDVSRTPVREALQRLAKDGLVVSRRRRWVVVEPTLEEIRDIYDVRTAIEGFAARLVIERATQGQLDAIIDALRSREHAGPGFDEFVISNERFHRLIVEASGNRRLIEAHERSKHFYFNTQVARLYLPSELEESHRQHQALVKAILERDGDEADRVTREHITGAFAIIQQRGGR